MRSFFLRVLSAHRLIGVGLELHIYDIRVISKAEGAQIQHKPRHIHLTLSISFMIQN